MGLLGRRRSEVNLRAFSLAMSSLARNRSYSLATGVIGTAKVDSRTREDSLRNQIKQLKTKCLKLVYNMNLLCSNTLGH